MTKRIPFLRGKLRFKPLQANPLILNVFDLNKFEKGSVIDEKFLIEKQVVKTQDLKKYRVKILGKGELKVSLTVKIPVSKSAKEKIEKAGGKAELGISKS